MFILPLFFVLMLRNKIPWYYFLLIPTVFFISIVPAWMHGRELTDLLRVYFDQSNRYPFLTMNFPNIYIWIDNAYYPTAKLIGVFITFSAVLVSGLFLSRKKYKFEFEDWVFLSFMSVVIVPFILPGMHERYMYLGDILGIVYFLVSKRNPHFPAAILLISLYSYIRCSRYNELLPMWPAFIVYLITISLMLVSLYRRLKTFSKYE